VAPTIEIRPLDRADDRNNFSCGDPSLDRFFQHFAGQNQFKLRLAVTYVAVAADHVLGFATVAAGSLERTVHPNARLGDRLSAYPLPILRLARLAVDQAAQGQGLGRHLLRFVLQLALTQRDVAGCVGVVTDAKPNAVPFYEQFGFTPLEGVVEGRVHGLPTPMFLDNQAVARAAGGH